MAHHTRGRKAEPRRADDALTKAPAVPRWLSAEAQAEWRRIMPGLVARSVLTVGDLATAEAYCLAVGGVRRAQATIAREGDTIVTRLGDTKRHPAFTTLREMLTAARQHAAELGLTPASRARVATGGDDNDDGASSDLGL